MGHPRPRALREGSRAPRARPIATTPARARSSTGRDRRAARAATSSATSSRRRSATRTRSARSSRALGYEVSIAIDREIVQYDLDGHDDPLRALSAHGRPRRGRGRAGADRARDRDPRAPARRIHHRPPSRLREALRGAHGGARRDLGRRRWRATRRSTSPMPDGELPELARSLRSLGAARDPATQAAHDAIFAPLIAARVRASRAEGRDVVHAFHGASLRRADRAGGDGGGDARHHAARRWRAPGRPRARDALGPLQAALAALDEQGRAAASASPGSEPWEAWVESLRRAFAAADEVCGQLARRARRAASGARNERRLVRSSARVTLSRHRASLAPPCKSRYISSAMRSPRRTLHRFLALAACCVALPASAQEHPARRVANIVSVAVEEYGEGGRRTRAGSSARRSTRRRTTSWSTRSGRRTDSRASNALPARALLDSIAAAVAAKRPPGVGRLARAAVRRGARQRGQARAARHARSNLAEGKAIFEQELRELPRRDRARRRTGRRRAESEAAGHRHRRSTCAASPRR